MPETEPVAPESASGGQEPRQGLFKAANCRRLDLRYRVTRDKFDISRFIKFFEIEDDDSGAGGVVCRTLDPNELDYHLHFNWQFSTEDLEFYVAFFPGEIPRTDGEHEPYAESFVPWFGSFFINDAAHADLRTQFTFPLEGRQNRFLPIPMKVSFMDELDAEIDGISVSLASAPEGIANARILQGKKRITIDLSGSVRTTFSTFDLRSELHRLSSFALKMTRSTK